jgi:NitT/TauT family transport system ATP-binding protein
MTLLSLKHISKSFESKLILKNISFDVEENSFVSIFGPNASGKTTLLNIISGLINPTKGELVWNNSFEKKVSYVFQNYRETLFPWRNVWENIALPLKLGGVEKNTRKQKVQQLIEKFAIDIDLNKFPYELSGGQQQLVSIMRAIITEPALLLLDEPFSALDFQKRLFLQSKLLEIWEQTKTTIIFVSHDLEEAIYMADEVILLGKNPTEIVKKQNVNIKRPREISDLATSNFITIKESFLVRFLEKNNLSI